MLNDRKNASLTRKRNIHSEEAAPYQPKKLVELMPDQQRIVELERYLWYAQIEIVYKKMEETTA